MAQVGIHPKMRKVTFLTPDGQPHFIAEIPEETKGGDEIYVQADFRKHPAWNEGKSDNSSFAKAKAEEEFRRKFGDAF